jgi:hypothetical protein
MTRSLLLILVAALVTACDMTTANDQCLRRELMKECLSQAATTSQESNIVYECRVYAQYASVKLTKQIKPECR